MKLTEPQLRALRAIQGTATAERRIRSTTLRKLADKGLIERDTFTNQLRLTAEGRVALREHDEGT